MKTKVFLSTIAILITLSVFQNAYASQIAKANATVKIRKTATISSNVLGIIPKGYEAVVLGEQNGFLKISFEGKTGYVKKEYFTLKKTSENQTSSKDKNINSTKNTSNFNAYVVKDGARLRAQKSTTSSIIKTLKSGEKLTVLSHENGGWLKVKTIDNKVGYIADYLIKETRKVSTSRGSIMRREADIPSNVPLAEKIVAYAKQFIGVRYVYGGESPSGFDCSGFVNYVYEKFGISLERSSADMANTNGVRISLSELKIGDLLFFDTNGGRNRVNHVGIYIGNGQYIHASNVKRCITVADLDSRLSSLMVVKRVIK